MCRCIDDLLSQSFHADAAQIPDLGEQRAHVLCVHIAGDDLERICICLSGKCIPVAIINVASRGDAVIHLQNVAACQFGKDQPVLPVQFPSSILK